MKKVNPAEYTNEEKITQNENVKKYAEAVTDLCSGKDSPVHLNNYKESVLKLLF